MIINHEMTIEKCDLCRVIGWIGSGISSKRKSCEGTNAIQPTHHNWNLGFSDEFCQRTKKLNDFENVTHDR